MALAQETVPTDPIALALYLKKYFGDSKWLQAFVGSPLSQK